MSPIIKKTSLSEVQKGIYFDCQIEDPAAYNLSATFLLDNLREDTFENACQLLIAEQEALRSSVRLIDSMPFLVIHDEVEFHILKDNLCDDSRLGLGPTNVTEGERVCNKAEESIAKSIIEEEISRVFLLDYAPLFRIRLLKLRQQSYVVICMHHIISDGLSLYILIQKLFTYYDLLIKNEPIRLVTDSGFFDFIQQENSKLGQGKYNQHKTFWDEKMKGAVLLSTKSEHSQKKIQGLGKEKQFFIPTALSKKLHAIAADNEVTPFMFFLATLSVLMRFYTKSSDIVLMSPLTFRPDCDYESAVGCFINTLPLRFSLKEDVSFSNVLSQASKALMDAYIHIEYPTNLILRNHMSLSQVNETANFGVLVVSDVYDAEDSHQVMQKMVDQDSITFPGAFMIALNQTPHQEILKVQYKTEIFSEAMIQSFGSQYLKLLDLVLTDVHLKMHQIDLSLENCQDWPLMVCDSTMHEMKVHDHVTNQHIENPKANSIEQQIVAIMQEVLGVDSVDIEDDFFDFGGHSLSLIQFNSKLKTALDIHLPLHIHFQFSTARALVSYLVEKNTQVAPVKKSAQQSLPKTHADIAIIGMSMQVPGAKDKEQFWYNLKHNKNGITYYNDAELLEIGIASQVIQSPYYVKACGLVDGIDEFDPAFFDYTPAEVNLMSPQFRLLNKGVWEAFEDSGYFPDINLPKIGLFLGGSDDFEWYKNVLFKQEHWGDKFQAFTLSSNHFLATRLAYTFDIQGPVYSALTACSTSLVACHLACQSLQLEECNLAIAGGVTLELPNEGGYFYEPGMMFSPDGQCRPFDANAEGTVFSNGMGLVVLKRLQEALKDEDHIYAVIKGSAISNDGRQKSGFTMPSLQGQSAAIQEAYRVAGVCPETVSYVEAHGTGTALGDPIEVNALSKAFATTKKQFCVLGSIKGNIGHTDSAAGVVGLAKVALSLKNRYIPGTVNYIHPNQQIDFENSPFVVTAQGKDWDSKNEARAPLRAGINSFGVGGTNAHMVLEQAPPSQEIQAASRVNLLVFSAKSKTALSATSKKIVSFLCAQKDLNLSDCAWTLQIGRKPFIYRKALVVQENVYKDTQEDLLQKLAATPVYESKPKKNIYFMFSGQGSQYQGMARDLYQSTATYGIASIFKRYMDEVLQLLLPEERQMLLNVLYSDECQQTINETEFAQLSLFSIEYALAKTLIALGITPQGMIGHSIGEITAAAVSGVFTLKDACEIVKARGRIMQQQKPGMMLLVMADMQVVQEALNGHDVWLALNNSTHCCVVAGSESAVTSFEQKADKLGLSTAKVKTSHAFHTPMMAEAADALRAFLAPYSLNEPRIPLISNSSGTWALSHEITSAAYWAKHMLNLVNFSGGLTQLFLDENAVFIEIGPSNILCSFAREHGNKTPGHYLVNLLRHPKEIINDEEYIYQKIGELWCLGIDIDWRILKGDCIRQRVSLPTYVFDTEYFPLRIKMSLQQGKVDEKPIIYNTAENTNTKNIEEKVLIAYRKTLGFDDIQLHSNFFALGGDSLKAVSLVSALGQFCRQVVDIKIIFQCPTPKELAATLMAQASNKSDDDDIAITPVEQSDYYPLSSAQNRMYALNLLDKSSIAYNLPSATLIKGRLDIARFEKALNNLILRHESLRTAFEIRNNQPIQIVHTDLPVTMTTLSSQQSQSLKDIDLYIYNFIQPFNLEQGPLYRAILIQFNDDSALFLFDLHHIIADGTSIEIITRDFNHFYHDKPLPSLLQYKDFAVWHNRFLSSETLIAQKKFWQDTLRDPPVLTLPLDFERPLVKTFAGGRIFFTFDVTISQKLICFSKQQSATLFMTLLSIWYVLLARYSGQEDIVIGVPIAGRVRKEITETVGMFINMLAMRNHISSKKTFIELLAVVKENVFNYFKHQDVQFDALLQELHLHRDLSRNALFDVCFDFQNMVFHDLAIDGVIFTPYPIAVKTAAYDLVLTCQENKTEGVIHGFIDYATCLFKKETIERMIVHLKLIVQQVLEFSDIKIEELNLVSDDDLMIINQLNATSIPLPNKTVLDLFEQNVIDFPEKIALIVADGHSYTYRVLNEKANALAEHLLKIYSSAKNISAQKDMLIGVLTPRDASLVVAILGVFKAGAAYVLIDHDLPKERINAINTVCNFHALICTSVYRNKIKYSGPVIYSQQLDFRQSANEVDSAFAQQTSEGEHSRLGLSPTKMTELKDPSDLAYVVFTSGSTGEPKGVKINHAALMNFVHDVKKQRLFHNDSHRILSVTTVSFDIFVFESIVPLCTGHSIYLANENEQLDPIKLSQKIIEHQVTHMVSTVSRVKIFVENNAFLPALKQLRCIISGGEHFPVQLLQTLRRCSNAAIHNMYGPTETTIWSTTQELTHADDVSIGKPIANTKVYIVNTAGQLQPIGVSGELCISGIGLADGYLCTQHAFAETARKFVPLSGIPNIRVYKTGDHGVLLADGTLRLMGRLDSQIKLRGYRISLSEIEAIVLKHEDVYLTSAKTVIDEHQQTHLVLYYSVKNNRSISNICLHDWLKEKLPKYMIPSHFVQVDNMPFLPNGKIDKKSLPLPQAYADKSTASFAATDLEKTLLLLWKEILFIDTIHIHDNFFDLGGHSLGLIQIQNRLTALGYVLELVQLFEYPTIASLAQYLTQSCTKNKTLSKTETLISMDIAVIGLACQFPGAKDVDEFWQNIVSGVESITQFAESELITQGISSDLVSNSRYIKAKGYLENVEFFDADFFGYSSQEANVMDPQARALHQCAYTVLENAGYSSCDNEAKIGLFAGSSSNILWVNNLIKKTDDLVNAYESLTFNEKDFLTTRLSYKLNLQGPSVTVQTACSTSLVAIHQAAQSLLNQECDMAIAGGVSISYPLKEGYLWQEGMIFSQDGHCKPFSDEASGFIPGNGCGLVLLKPLTTALYDNDTIYAVIKGSAINNDGIVKVGYTAPSVTGQCNVIEKALNKASISAENICHLEAHGTATTIGDPIEIEALKKAWKTEKKNYCAIGSVKANIGHLDAAAGVAGFIKSVLLLHHKTIPPLLHFKHANPMIDLENSPFYVATEARKLNSPDCMLAAVSSFGIGGTNAHIILEQAPSQQQSQISQDVHILIFSAKSEQALSNLCKAMLNTLQRSEINLADAAFTLQVGRRAFAYRKILVINKEWSTVTEEEKLNFITSAASKIPSNQKTYVFIFSNDIVYEAVAELLSNKSGVNTIFIKYFEEISSLLQNIRLKKLAADDDNVVLYSQQLDFRRGANERDEGVYTQYMTENERVCNKAENSSAKSIFAGGYALAKTLMTLGITPKGMMGEGIGKITAMFLAGMLDIRDIIEIIQSVDSSPDSIAERLSLYDLKSATIPILSSCDKTHTIFIEIGLKPGNANLYLSKILGQMWCEGFNINWKKLYSQQLSFRRGTNERAESKRRRISLPSYVFEKTVYKSDIVLLKNNHTPISAKTRHLADLWQEIFGKRYIQAEDDFFAIGGDSLKAVVLANKIQKTFDVDIPLAVIFQHAKFNQMEKWIQQHAKIQRFTQIQQAGKRAYYPATPAQKRLFALHEILENATPYNLAASYLIEGPIDIEKLRLVFAALLQRHEVLKTRFAIVDGEVVQCIDDTAHIIVDFAEIAETKIDSAIKDYIKPFDLTKAPLIKVKLLHIRERRHVLLIDLHHIIADQFSIAILLHDLNVLYSGQYLPPLKIQYKDFAVWQANLLTQPTMQAQLEYWKNILQDAPRVLNMPIDFPRSQLQTFRGGRVAFEIDNKFSSRIDELAQVEGLTPYMIFMAIFNLTLWKITGQHDLVIGTAIAGRSNADLSSVVGMFANTLAIRMHIDNKLTVKSYLQFIKNTMIHAYANQDCQLETLVTLLELDRDFSRNPLFDVVINYIDIKTEALCLDVLTVTPLLDVTNYSKFDMTWTIEKINERYYTNIEYNASLFKETTIEKIKVALQHVLAFILHECNATLTNLSILTPVQQKWLIDDLNQTKRDYPKHQTIQELFETQATEHGDRTAIVWQDKTISYQELNEAANQMALLMKKHVKQGDKVALLLERDPLQIICILGVLKLGCVYVPIDPTFPLTRIRFIITDSASSLLVTQSQYNDLDVNPIPKIIIDLQEALKKKQSMQFTSITCKAEDAAYVMYTSGSTGKPKGVLVGHRQVVRVVKDKDLIHILPSDKLLQLSNFAFDGSVFDIFGALLNGASLVMIPDFVTIDLPCLAEVIQKQHISVFFITSALFNALVDYEISSLKYVRKILIGGDALSIEHVRKALAILGPDKLINAYGPTETTVFAAYYPINYIQHHELSIPIGYPIANTRLYILDQECKPVPSYVPGELYIGGDGVAKEYLNRPELTQYAFLNDPFVENGRMYRTGDLAKRLSNGAVVFLGRQDFQVKIRGFRIELGEVENTIQSISGVKSVAVIAQKDNHDNDFLTAYYVHHEMTPIKMQTALTKILPFYMIPQHFMQIDLMPLNRVGKIDRKALLAMKNSAEKHTAPKSETEKIILQEMQRILNNTHIGIHDDFFHCGGHSIKAIALVYALLQHGIKIKINEVFQYPTAAALAVLPNIALCKEDDVQQKPLKNKNSVILNVQQINSMLTHVESSYNLLSTLVTAAQSIKRFPLSAVQRLHLSYPSRFSGFTISIQGEIDNFSICQMLATIITSNQLLHCAIQNEETLEWSEFDKSAAALLAKNIPYLDLTDYAKETQATLLTELRKKIFASPYQKTQLPWRLVCIRIKKDTHLLIWGFDHIAFDGMSAEILEQQIQNAIWLKSMPQPQRYEDYVALLKRGPQDVMEDDIITLFLLSKWRQLNDTIITKLQEKTISLEKEIEIKIQLTKTADPWEVTLDLITKILADYFAINQIPLGLVHYGRHYQHESYYQCVGEFLDVIPILTSFDKQKADMTVLLEQCRLHAIHFLSLLYDPDVSLKYLKIKQILSSAYPAFGPLAMVLLNFQGMISQEEKHKFKNSFTKAQPALALCSITANYDESELSIHISSSYGIDVRKIRKIIQLHKKKQHSEIEHVK